MCRPEVSFLDCSHQKLLDSCHSASLPASHPSPPFSCMVPSCRRCLAGCLAVLTLVGLQIFLPANAEYDGDILGGRRRRAQVSDEVRLCHARIATRRPFRAYEGSSVMAVQRCGINIYCEASGWRRDGGKVRLASISEIEVSPTSYILVGGKRHSSTCICSLHLSICLSLRSLSLTRNAHPSFHFVSPFLSRSIDRPSLSCVIDSLNRPLSRGVSSESSRKFPGPSQLQTPAAWTEEVRDEHPHTHLSRKSYRETRRRWYAGNCSAWREGDSIRCMLAHPPIGEELETRSGGGVSLGNRFAAVTCLVR